MYMYKLYMYILQSKTTKMDILSIRLAWLAKVYFCPLINNPESQFVPVVLSLIKSHIEPRAQCDLEDKLKSNESGYQYERFVR